VNKRTRAKPSNVCVMLHALTVKPHSYADLAAISGLSMPTVSAWVKQLHALKMVHISEWGGERNTLKLFLWGKAPDAKKPEAMTAAQRVAKMRNKK
jgi:hypothetical protein